MLFKTLFLPVSLFTWILIAASLSSAGTNVSARKSCQTVMDISKNFRTRPNDPSMVSAREDFEALARKTGFRSGNAYVAACSQFLRYGVRADATPGSAVKTRKASAKPAEKYNAYPYTKWNPNQNECTFDMQCGSFEICVQHQCVDQSTFANRCTQDTDCSMAKHCESGSCR